MTRLDSVKNKIKRSIEKKETEEKLTLIYQESINQLPSYKEQKEFNKFYEDLKKEKATV